MRLPALAVLATCSLLATGARAYDGPEHRDIGERAFIDAYNVVHHSALPLPKLPWVRSPGGRWVTCESENKKIGGCDTLGTGNRLLVWVGNRTDGAPGDWATFGELVELASPTSSRRGTSSSIASARRA